MPYIYQAENWCDSCGRQIKRDIKKAGHAPEDPSDEATFDSDEYPKYASRAEPHDCPNHCAAGEKCLEAITLDDGTRIGALVTENLTAEGERYVIEAVKEGGQVATEVWKDEFSYLDFEENEEDGEDTEEECYYNNDKCSGRSWQCQTCGEYFCQHHSHVTDKGTNVECVACERARKTKEGHR